MTDIDYQANLMLNYVDHELHAAIPLTAPVSEMWRQRYEALAQAKNVQIFRRTVLGFTLPGRPRACGCRGRT
jgi:hypothetical protein